MPKTVISYDKPLPEIAGRCPWRKPVSFLVKDVTTDTGWREDKSGRRPSSLLLIERLRATVDAWREAGYPGISETGRRLFEYWFEEEHVVAGFDGPFRYHFCQREAIETLVYLVEIFGRKDAEQLVRAHAQIRKRDLLSQNIEFQTTMDGTRQIRRYVAELDKEGIQDLPPADLFRAAFKMATGSGKTWVMTLAIVYSHFHKKREPGSPLSTNFLIVAPNVIVFQRLERDFAHNAVFNQLPLVPPEWRPWNQKVLLRGDGVTPDASCNLFLTNIQQLYEARGAAWTPANAVEALLGQKPAKDLGANEPAMLDRLKALRDLVVINDEAHHVHDADLAWNQSLLSIHKALPKGLALWLDFSATPKDQDGMYYPWIVVDYPLAQAVEDQIVKVPLMVTCAKDPKRPIKEPERITKDNVVQKYAYWIEAAVGRWKDHAKAYKPLGIRPVLFVMVEKSDYADAVGEHLWKTKEFGFKVSEVLVIHTDRSGEITKKDLELARAAARDIDSAKSGIKAIVSVMMLREGWDVKNVSVVLGLRPFTAAAEILPEQVIGRGLRKMPGVGPDRIQTLEVLGTQKLLAVLKEQLEAEGVGVGGSDGDPPKPVIIEALLERRKLDIALPITKPCLTHNARKLGELDVAKLEPIFKADELAEPFRIKLTIEFAQTDTEVHQAEIAPGGLPIAQELVSLLVDKVNQLARLSLPFAELYPIVRTYLRTRCFGQDVDLDGESIRSHLNTLDIKEAIARYLARKIAELTVERRELEFEKAEAKLSDTKPFHWRRNLVDGPLTCRKTIFNYVATFNDFERRFARMLDAAPDVLRFASLGTTEQGDSGTAFRVDYLKPSGAIGFYYPDWAVVQKTEAGEVNWIIETKGRVWEDTAAKDAAMTEWCSRIGALTGQCWRFCRVNQSVFDQVRPKSLKQAVETASSAAEHALM